MRRKKIGTMDFHGSVDITDPCYNRDVWCRMTDVKIRNGVYTCIAWHHKDKGTFDNGEPYTHLFQTRCVLLPPIKWRKNGTEKPMTRK